MKRALLAAVLAGLACLAFPPSASRASGMEDYAPDEVARVDILSGWRMANGHHMAAIRIRLADGWKTYWRAPGEAGIPPEFDWSGSQNVSAISLHWPRPQVFVTNGMRTVGYHDELILPVEIAPESPGGEIRLAGRIHMGVCRDVCMPMDAAFDAHLAPERSADTALVRQALAAQPKSATAAGLRTATCAVEPIADGLRVTLRLVLPPVGPGEFVAIEAPDPAVWVSEAEVSRAGGTLSATADLVPPTGQPFALSRSDLRITVLTRDKAVEIEGCAAP